MFTTPMAPSDGPEMSSSSQSPKLDSRHILGNSTASTQRQPPASSFACASRNQRSNNIPASNSRPATGSTSTSLPSANSRHDNQLPHRDVRSLPPWIESFEAGDEQLLDTKATDRLISTPTRSRAAQHHFGPSQLERRVSQDGYVDEFEDLVQEKKADLGFFGGHREPVKGRKWDHAREGEPVIMQSRLASASPWRTYIMSSMYGPASTEEVTKVDENFLEQQTPGYMKPWRGDLDDSSDPEKLSSFMHIKKRQKSFMARVQHVLLMHSLVPLVFRIIVLATSTIALGLSGSLYHLSNKYLYAQNPSTTMAIVVDVVALPYILYITWDEYTGKPLGLRSPKAKIRLVLLDLFFIIFESANLALAFGASTDVNGGCRTGVNGANSVICGRLQALCVILMVALIAWSLTFSVSIFRLVERVGGREETD